MKIEDQVASLEISKRLFELGVKQDSLFYLFRVEKSKDFTFSVHRPYQNCEKYSAFTASEIIDLLPHKMNGSYLEITKNGESDASKNSFYQLSYPADRSNNFFSEEKKLSDAAADLLIYLIENKLIEI